MPTIQEQLHKLIDALPEDQLPAVLEAITPSVSRRG
jgi:hypothetical protein